MSVNITEQPFGEFEGKKVNKYIIGRSSEIKVSVINYGATITSIIAPDKSGLPADVVLGFDTLDGYIKAGHFYFGGICGRFANRIAGGRFSINGNEYQLSKNNAAGCLHGGFKGFDKKYWQAEVLPEKNGVEFSYTSKDGEEGFPGNLTASVLYQVVDDELHITFKAVTDKATPVNLTSHSYFNLSGGNDRDILEHELLINGNKIAEVDEEYIPTGFFLEILHSPLDFTQLRKIDGGKIRTSGFDYSWALEQPEKLLTEAAMLVHRKSGRCMTVFTTQPAIHFYSGHYLDGKMTDTKNGAEYNKYAGLCLESQHFGDSPNRPEFPNTIINPGETYFEKTVLRFSCNSNE